MIICVILTSIMSISEKNIRHVSLQIWKIFYHSLVKIKKKIRTPRFRSSFYRVVSHSSTVCISMNFSKTYFFAKKKILVIVLRFKRFSLYKTVPDKQVCAIVAFLISLKMQFRTNPKNIAQRVYKHFYFWCVSPDK